MADKTEDRGVITGDDDRDEEQPDNKEDRNSISGDDDRDEERAPVRCCDTSIKRFAWCTVIFCILLATAALLSVSIKKVDSTEYGVIYNIHTKQLDEAARTGGLHTGPPGFKFIRFPSTFITEDLDDTCLSKDGLRVDFSATFQYQMPADWLVPAVLKYRDYNTWTSVVKAAGDSAVQHSCSEFNITNFQNKRGVIQLAMEENLRLKLEGEDGRGTAGVYARAVSLQLNNVNLPERYSSAVADKQSANEDIALAINQRNQEVTKAQTALLAANEQARKIMDTSANDANVTLTQARLKAEETLFAFAAEAETIVRVKDALNLTVEGILGFSANQLLATVPNLKVSAGEPARFSQKDQL